MVERGMKDLPGPYFDAKQCLPHLQKMCASFQPTSILQISKNSMTDLVSTIDDLPHGA